MSVAELLFWSSGFIIFYSYFGYLVVLKLVSSVKSVRLMHYSENFKPSVTLLISAYNEEAVIEDKILNSLDLNYPKDLLEIVVISDASNDTTDQVVTRYVDKGVQLRRYDGRIGKTACLNKALPLAKGEIIVFSDANSIYNKNAVKELIKHFEDMSIGFVTGLTKYTAEDGGSMGSIGIYSRIEMLTKKLESKIGSCVGADGAIFAIRKNLYAPLKNSDINDLVIPLNIIKTWFHGKFEENSSCIEDTAGSNKGEFNRQVRITARTLRAVFNNKALLNPLKYGFFSFELFSHKVLRLTAPFFLLTFFVSNTALISEDPVYTTTFLMQSAFYFSALLGFMGAGINLSKKVFSVSYTFSTVNAAILWGWCKYLKGETYVTWSPTKR